jgi:hypothetical protein
MLSNIHPAVKRLKQATLLLIGLSVASIAFGGYSFLTNNKVKSDLDDSYEVESKELAQAQRDSEAVDSTGNFHRLVGDKASQAFALMLQREADRIGVKVVKGVRDDKVDPFASLSGGPAKPGWAMVRYEFDLQGDARAIHLLFSRLCESGMAFELDTVTYSRLQGANGTFTDRITAHAIVHLVGRMPNTAKVAPPKS